MAKAGSKCDRGLTVERLRETLVYEPTTGLFRWAKSSGKRESGTIAGTRSKTGYVTIHFDGGRFPAHRLAWLYVHGKWPTDVVDHINGVRDDNRIVNLRDVTVQINTHNARGVHAKNSLGIAGVSPHRNKYRAFIRVNYKLKHLGLFDTPEEAQAAYLAAKRLVLPDFELAPEQQLSSPRFSEWRGSPAGFRAVRGSFFFRVSHGLKHGCASRSTPIICEEHR